MKGIELTKRERNAVRKWLTELVHRQDTHDTDRWRGVMLVRTIGEATGRNLDQIEEECDQ